MVDALRGYAVLLVIAVHSIGHNENLVWPAKRLMLLGFYGVQLFFLASALTLLMSWYRSRDPILIRSSKFLIRRFFRIAPLYYLAIPFYWFAYEMRPELFSFELLLSSLLFYNAWSPYLIPTVPGWTPVPGGWSISVEFGFYFLFPILAITSASLTRSLVFLAIALLIMAAASSIGAGMYPGITIEGRSNFLYFWPPNQLVIFSLGFVLYHLVSNPAVRRWLGASRVNASAATVALCLMLSALAFYGVRKFFEWSSWLPPTHLVISVLFLGWSLVLVIKPYGFAINKAIVGLGTVSFSAYVLHFAVLKFLGPWFKAVWPFATTGILSVCYSAAFLAVAVIVTRYAAAVTYRCIELPGIDLGKHFIRRFYPT